MSAPANRRTDTASRMIAASAHTLYRAYLDRDAIAAWRPPQGMRAEIHAFDPHEGGGYRMSFIYMQASDEAPGKTTAHADTFEGRFVELIPDQRIVEHIEFITDNPAFAGPMTIITTLKPVPGGTEVTVACENVPAGISESDHQAGLASSLANLASFTE
ncbi:SRPBCC family protein [Hyphomicrobium sp. LHD-15]|uniref:SRPBCC family protein n=1 Tax=Hyphomicrobium sp. LHD-15 TaxID=3072142 RepID=UPI00280D0060|nr:SRPBCC family protein [Hyphomicrobium sp. LHD-15]MDQ8699606.1 SRPBCC family protein [Hyphomicrobium sp. LHD-15]